MTTKVKLTSKSMCLNYEFDVQIGELKATLQAGVWVTPKKEGEGNSYDCEFQDVTNISYMGMEIKGYDNWKKFRDFHGEMGINFTELLDQEFHKVMTDEKLNKLVNEIKF
jgi:hypothetical protein